MTLPSTDPSLVHLRGHSGDALTSLRGLGAVRKTRPLSPREDYVPGLSHRPDAERRATPMTALTAIPVLIVAYGNASDVVACLNALSHVRSQPGIEIFICENGGPPAFGKLITALTAPNGPCRDYGDDQEVDAPLLKAQRVLRLEGEAHGTGGSRWSCR